MEYWDMVVEEVVREDGPPYPFSFTNIELYRNPLKVEDKDMHSPAKKKRTRNKYYIGENFPNAYFTHMEFQTLIHMLKGDSTTQIASKLLLSKRTIEFYIRNMKAKVKCKYRGELLEHVLKSEIIDLITQDYA